MACQGGRLPSDPWEGREGARTKEHDETRGDAMPSCIGDLHVSTSALLEGPSTGPARYSANQHAHSDLRIPNSLIEHRRNIANPTFEISTNASSLVEIYAGSYVQYICTVLASR